MKSLHAGEKIRRIYAINCKYGKSSLVITNFGIMVENFNSMVLDLEHSMIISIQATDSRSVKVIWKENNDIFDFVFKSETVDEVISVYRTVKNDYIETLKSIGVRMDISEEQITIQSSVLESRFEEIPTCVTDENIWND